MTLLLGSPGSGKSTLLKLLSGRLTSKHLQVRAAASKLSWQGTPDSQSALHAAEKTDCCKVHAGPSAIAAFMSTCAVL